MERKKRLITAHSGFKRGEKMPFQSQFDDGVEIPDAIYKCGRCNNIILGIKSQFCSDCGAKLNWKKTTKKGGLAIPNIIVEGK